MKLNYIVTKDAIHLNFDGKHYKVKSTDKNYLKIRNLIKNNLLDQIPFAVEGRVAEEYVKDSGLTMHNNKLYDLDGEQLPETLSCRLVELKEEGFGVDNLVKFWTNIKENPSLKSREMLYKFLEHNGHPITEDGCFIGYRGIRSDFTDCNSGTFDNSPGSVCVMPRDKVDPDPTRTCSFGLHVGAWEYSKTFGQIRVEVKVNPRDVVAVPDDYNGTKMRVCRFEVLRVCSDLNNDVLYGHERRVYGEPEEEEEFYQETVEEILELAGWFKAKYGIDRLILANRIEEEVEGGYGLTVTDILKILNDNEGAW